MQCHIQLEDRVAGKPDVYHHSGNVLLDKILGAKMYYYPDGEDEAGADRKLAEIAEGLRAKGKKPYIIPLSLSEKPKGALGYVDAAFELDEQLKTQKIDPSAIIVASGSAYTHVGLLAGLRLLKNKTSVIGACVRRNAQLQTERAYQCSQYLCNNLLKTPNLVSKDDIQTQDFCLDGGYGQVTQQTKDAIKLLAHKEGLLSDPVYTGKAFACLFGLISNHYFSKGDDIVIIHTGGTPALFAYKNDF